MISKEPKESKDTLKEILKEYYIISKDTGPILNNPEGNDTEKVFLFYGALFIANEEITDFQLSLSSYKELGKRLDISEGSIKKAHQRLREKGVITRSKESPLNHRITDGGIQKIIIDYSL